MHKPLTAIPMSGLDRRHFLAALGAGLIATPPVFAGPSPEHILPAASTFCADADSQRFHAGMTRVTVLDIVPFDTLIAYPTEVAEVPFQAGPFTIAASRDAPIASGTPFPIVLFSHGNGRAGGSSLRYSDLFTSLTWIMHQL